MWTGSAQRLNRLFDVDWFLLHPPQALFDVGAAVGLFDVGAAVVATVGHVVTEEYLYWLNLKTVQVSLRPYWSYTGQ